MEFTFRGTVLFLGTDGPLFDRLMTDLGATLPEPR
jgi:hypothetical protein